MTAEEKMYQCPYERASKCTMKDGCSECETFGEYLNGNIIPISLPLPSRETARKIVGTNYFAEDLLREEAERVNFMQTRDLTDEEWMKLSKKEILQLYKNCYSMLLKQFQSLPSGTAVAYNLGTQWRMDKTEEIAENIYQVFKNTERIHGNSDAIDWIKVASYKTVDFFARQNNDLRDKIIAKLKEYLKEEKKDEYCQCKNEPDVFIESLEPPIARCTQCNRIYKDGFESIDNRTQIFKTQ